MKRTSVHHDSFNSRSSLLTAFLVVCFVLVVFRLFTLQVIQGAQNRALAENQHSIFRTVLPTRGEIKITDKFSTNTYPVATNIQHYLVYAVPQEIKNPQVVANSLGQVLSLDPKDILPKIIDQGKKYVPLKKQLTDEEQTQIKQLSLVGIYFDSEDARFYPEQNLLSKVLGFVGYNKDSQRVGLYGLEKSFQTDLAGKPGSVHEERDAGGASIFGSSRQTVPAINGTNLVLTIDKSIQFKAQSVLHDTVTKHGADSGSIIVVNPKTGAVLAMAGFPDFNPNQYNQVTDPAVFSNEATIGNYEPGSTFKAITMAASIDEGKMSPDSTYTDTGKVAVDNYVIKNAEAGGRGVQTMTQALDFSLNTGAIYAQSLIGNSEFLKYVKKFGFGKKTGIELPESSGGLDNILKGNISVNYDTASFGQGITVTPIQLIQAYTALANDGKMMKPYIVQSKIKSDGTTINTAPQVVDQIISAQTAHTVSAMLVDVVENGFGKKAAVPGYYLGGKTGTAQVVGTNGKYEANNNIGSFIGYGPIENPQFLMLVRVNHPRDVQFAESTAGPAWGEMAKFILDYYNIAPTRQVNQKK